MRNIAYKLDFPFEIELPKECSLLLGRNACKYKFEVTGCIRAQRLPLLNCREKKQRRAPGYISTGLRASQQVMPPPLFYGYSRISQKCPGMNYPEFVIQTLRDGSQSSASNPLVITHTSR